jgi:hypothetical protein
MKFFIFVFMVLVEPGNKFCIMFMVELELFQLGSPLGLKVRQGGGFFGFGKYSS